LLPRFIINKDPKLFIDLEVSSHILKCPDQSMASFRQNALDHLLSSLVKINIPIHIIAILEAKLSNTLNILYTTAKYTS
jgi:hypothetical protein